MKLAFVVALGVAMLPTAASADWQFTRWGMTPTQVITAARSTGPVVAAPPNEKGEVDYVGSYRSGEHAFKATYYFTNGKLSTVHLETTNGCGDMAIEMHGVYGKSVSESNVGIGHITRWIDRKKSNNVQLLNFGDSCTLIYSKLDTTSGLGL